MNSNEKTFNNKANNVNLIFEGNYANGERNGNGKEYDYIKGELIFDGEYIKKNMGMEKNMIIIINVN